MEITIIFAILGVLAGYLAHNAWDAYQNPPDLVPPAPTESYNALSDRVTALTERLKHLEGEVSAWEQRVRSAMGTVGKLKQMVEAANNEPAVDKEANLNDLLAREQEDFETSVRQPIKTRQVRRR